MEIILFMFVQMIVFVENLPLVILLKCGVECLLSVIGKNTHLLPVFVGTLQQAYLGGRILAHL